MKLGVKTKEKIARTIGEYFSTNDIVNVFTDANISTDKSLYAKWRIILDAFSKITAEGGISRILEEFCHPLNFADLQIRQNFIDALNNILSYEDAVIQSTDCTAKIILINEQLPTKEEIEGHEAELKAKALPDVNKSTYSEKVIDLVAKEFCAVLSCSDIQKTITPIIKKNTVLFNQEIIKEYLSDSIEMPFYDFNDVLQVIRKKDEEADETISTIIAELLHPLNYSADENKASILANKIKKYLKYDDFYIEKIGNRYWVCPNKPLEDYQIDSQEFTEKEKNYEIRDNRKIKDKKDLVKGLRDNHQAYMDIVEIFCRDPKKPTKELNDAYGFLSKKIQKTIDELDLQYYKLSLYKPFTNDLYTAEIEWNGSGKVGDIRLGPSLSWDAIRPSLYEAHSNMVRICNIAEESSQMTGDEKNLEAINNLISQKRTQEKATGKNKVKELKLFHIYESKKEIKKTLTNSVVKFDDTVPAIFVDEVEIPLPAYGKEHYFCRAMWKRKLNEAIDWSEIYNDMESKGVDFIPDKELWRYVYDAKNDVNKRIKDITGTTEKLFDWNSKTVKRLY